MPMNCLLCHTNLSRPFLLALFTLLLVVHGDLSAQPPGTGAALIQTHAFTVVYDQGQDPGGGIGGFDLKSPADQAFAFDYEGTGKLDHLVFYRPAHGTTMI